MYIYSSIVAGWWCWDGYSGPACEVVLLVWKYPHLSLVFSYLARSGPDWDWKEECRGMEDHSHSRSRESAAMRTNGNSIFEINFIKGLAYLQHQGNGYNITHPETAPSTTFFIYPGFPGFSGQFIFGLTPDIQEVTLRKGLEGPCFRFATIKVIGSFYGYVGFI